MTIHSSLFAAAMLGALMQPAPASAQLANIEPAYSIWDVELGKPVTQIPAMEVTDIACGTNGGPPSTPIASLAEYASCPVESSGLREIHFANDDEVDYIAKALELEYRVLQGGTSIYAHPVIVSVLVGDQGAVRGYRIVTDDRVSARERRIAVTLARNLKARFGSWVQDCTDIPLRPGENPVGRQFVHEVCTAESKELAQRLRIESYFYRKRGQEALNRETQEVNTGYFHSGTRLEVVQMPYRPSEAPAE